MKSPGLSPAFSAVLRSAIVKPKAELEIGAGDGGRFNNNGNGRPQPVGDLKWVKASYDSVHGKVVSEWNRETGKFNLRVRIPVGVTATVILPSKEGTTVKESGRPIEHASGIERLTRVSGDAVVAVGSGEYEFGSEP